MKKFIAIILSVCVLLSVNAQTEIKNGVVIDHGAEKIVKKVIAQIDNDMPFSFEFTYAISEEGKSQEGSGKFLSSNSKYCITSDKFCHWSNGVTMWNYLKTNNEVEVMDVEDGNTMFNFVKIINQSSNNFRPKFIRTEIFNKTNCNIIDLTPKTRSSISKIRIYSAKTTNRIMRLEISTYEGAHYKYTFSNYKTKLKVTDNNFIFPHQSYPKVKIVDLR